MSNLSVQFVPFLARPPVSNRVSAPFLHRGGEFEIEPVLLGVVGAIVHGPPILPFVHEPGEVRAFALASDGLREPLLAIGGIVRARHGVAFRARGSDHIERVGNHFLRAARFAALVVLHVAVVEVQHQDALGERLDFHQLGGRCGQIHPRQERGARCQRGKPRVRKAVDRSHNQWVGCILATSSLPRPPDLPAIPGHRLRKDLR